MAVAGKFVWIFGDMYIGILLRRGECIGKGRRKNIGWVKIYRIVSSYNANQ